MSVSCRFISLELAMARPSWYAPLDCIPVMNDAIRCRVEIDGSVAVGDVKWILQTGAAVGADIDSFVYDGAARSGTLDFSSEVKGPAWGAMRGPAEDWIRAIEIDGVRYPMPRTEKDARAHVADR